MGNKEPWQCSSTALCSNSGSSIEVNLLLKVMGPEGAAAVPAPGEEQKQRDAVGCCSQRGAHRCPGSMPGQQDTAEVAHSDQGHALCLSLLVLELPGTRELGWVCAQHQGNKMCLSLSAAH